MLTGAAASFGALFSQLAAAERLPAVIHCLGGKDRTGLAIALLLTALGVRREWGLGASVNRYLTVPGGPAARPGQPG